MEFKWSGDNDGSGGGGGGGSPYFIDPVDTYDDLPASAPEGTLVLVIDEDVLYERRLGVWTIFVNPGQIDNIASELAGLTAYTEDHVNNSNNPHGVTKSQVGLGNVENAAASTLYVPLTQKGAANGVATLDAGGLIPSSQLPPVAITETFVVASQAAQTALTAQIGDVAVRSDLNKSYILMQEPASTFSNWTELLTPTDTVLSVNGQTGVVSLTKTDVGLGNVDNTSDASKNAAAATLTNKALTNPVITGQATAPTYFAGKMWYDTADNTMRYYNDSTSDSVNIGQELNVVVRNTSGSTITAGQVLRITGGSSSRPTVALAQSNAFSTSKVFAIATETILNNSNGYATIAGLVKNLNLSAFAVGDELYLSATVAGGLTNVRPTSPNYAQPIGAVADNSVNGRLIVDFGARRGIGYGSADQMLGMNSAGTQPEYKTAQATRTAILPSQASANGQVLTSNGTDVLWTSSLTNPMSAVGDLIVGGTSGAATRLAPNTTTDRKVLTQTGTGSAGQTPVWSDDAATVSQYGRVKGGVVPGQTSGSATAAGYIGEVIEATQATLTSIGGASLDYRDILSVTLTPGLWTLTGLMTFGANSGTNTTVQVGISATSGNAGTGLSTGVSLAEGAGPTANYNASLVVPNRIVNITTSTTYYLKARSQWTGAAPTAACRLIAVRVG